MEPSSWATPWAVRSDARRVLERVRSLRQRGPRVVLDAPREGLGFGNFLYFWLHADQARRAGTPEWVVVPDGLTPWLDAYPALRALSLSAREVRASDRRVFHWNSRFGIDFTRDQLHRFMACYLVSDAEPTTEASPDVAVNVKRGVYYSAPHFRGTYSFDIAAYLGLALERMAQREPVGAVTVISDDLDWCELKLDDLFRRSAGTVTYLRTSPHEQFASLSRFRRIVGTNTTFSYWGAYVSSWRFPAVGHVVMPKFHGRLGDEPWAYQLDPDWDIVEDLPGGWDA